MSGMQHYNQLIYASYTIEKVRIYDSLQKKSRIRETKNLSTDADSRTDTILERLRDSSIKKK